MNRWRDPATKAFSVEIDRPAGKSCDNHALLTAEAYFLGLIPLSECEEICSKFELEPGLLVRYPGVIDFSKHDDYIGFASVSLGFAERALAQMTKRDWTLPGKNPLVEWIGRQALLEPVIRAKLWLPLSPLNQAKVILAYLMNCFERKSETSGKILLLISAPVFAGYFSGYPYINAAINVWRAVMAWRYPCGPVEIFEIYFPPKEGVSHPFVAAAPKAWSARSN